MAYVISVDDFGHYVQKERTTNTIGVLSDNEVLQYFGSFLAIEFHET